MRLERVVPGLVLAIPMTAYAHPGHVHRTGLVHGFSWVDWLGLLAIAAVALAFARRRDR
jgi:hypothetical protein